MGRLGLRPPPPARRRSGTGGPAARSAPPDRPARGCPPQRPRGAGKRAASGHEHQDDAGKSPPTREVQTAWVASSKRTESARNSSAQPLAIEVSCTGPVGPKRNRRRLYSASPSGRSASAFSTKERTSDRSLSTSYVLQPVSASSRPTSSATRRSTAASSALLLTTPYCRNNVHSASSSSPPTGEDQGLGTCAVRGEVRSPNHQRGMMGVSRNLSSAPTVSLRDRLRRLLTEPVRRGAAGVPPTCTSERARGVMERDGRTQAVSTPGRERSEFTQVNQRFRWCSKCGQGRSRTADLPLFRRYIAPLAASDRESRQPWLPA